MKTGEHYLPDVLGELDINQNREEDALLDEVPLEVTDTQSAGRSQKSTSETEQAKGNIHVDKHTPGLSDLDTVNHFIQKAKQFRLLTPEQEIDLAKRIERGDLNAKEKLINSNLRLLVSIARNYEGHGVKLDDLIQEGSLGLIRATEKYDYRKGYRFSTYGTIWIRQALGRGIAFDSRTVRLSYPVHQKLQKIEKAERILMQELGRDQTPEEIAMRVDMAGAEVTKVKNMEIKTLSLDKPLSEESGSETLADHISSEETVDEDIVHTVALEGLSKALRETMQSVLDKRERDILSRRFGLDTDTGLPETAQSVGVAYGMKPASVKSTVDTSLKRLKDAAAKDAYPLHDAVAEFIKAA
jgi:RNA polymerase primary sigma factor